ncbi:MAG: cobalamin-dependent protein, partial [Planctomycetales bacterium]|nr:cobalamin-dependent protein [Planctomycetales bacterium]
IVGVVLGCNSYEVIDLGVMVSCEKILEEAKKHGVDVIGLSGLITPSLDQMVHVAGEMQREGFDVPLLIGGATTSAKHTAVKIAPAYQHAVVHVQDASRCVGVVERLLSSERSDQFLAENRELQAQLVTSYRQRQAKLLPYDEACRRAFATDWSHAEIEQPDFVGTRT